MIEEVYGHRGELIIRIIGSPIAARALWLDWCLERGVLNQLTRSDDGLKTLLEYRRG